MEHDLEQKTFRDCLNKIICLPEMHARWLNSLSYLENCGARKIAACEHPTKVPKQMLKHAAEEFRHAYFLKQQIVRLGIVPYDTYGQAKLLGGCKTLHYLDKLEVEVCRFLKYDYGLSLLKLKEAAYLLVTYAIEMRASTLYPEYQHLLSLLGSKVTVRSIIIEEDNHLADMQAELDILPFGDEMAKKACIVEKTIFDEWLQRLVLDANPYPPLIVTLDCGLGRNQRPKAF